LPVLAACGLAVTVPHAPAIVKSRAHHVTVRDGGSGAVRETADLILAARSASAVT
jgi:3-deoxy-D-manno-octulosonate 8-phosphate phosphatase (KDO 8-P phosphatase)